MTKVVLTGFKFKPVNLKRRSPKPKSNIVSKKLYCVCIEEEQNVFKAYVNITSDLEFPDTLTIPFTENSYNLKGKTRIFSKDLDKKGKHICICRTKVEAEQHPGIQELYTPFRNKYVYAGYIVINNGQHEFEMVDVIDHYLNVNHLVPNIRLNDKNIYENTSDC